MKTYISLFSSAGVGCYGFKLNGFECIATCELLSERLKIQKFNNKCQLEGGYICGDMTKDETHNLINEQIQLYKDKFNIEDVDVIIATPLCQGMSELNRKRNDELKRNSLVIESIKVINEIKPKFFIFENVRAFMKTTCTDCDGINKPIHDAIFEALGKSYDIYYEIINFCEYGNPSSRTRTLVIGTRKDLNVNPNDFFPDKEPTRTIRYVIGNFKPLTVMGEIDENDIYHSFRPYPERLTRCIAATPQGCSAIDNANILDKPYHIDKDGNVKYSVSGFKNKYYRQIYDNVPRCITTRNDTLSSQSTVHPIDNRVFSIRELMEMQSIPKEFNWSEKTFEELNAMSIDEKKSYLKANALNIRRNIGECVPTIIFKKIAAKIAKFLDK